MIEHLRKVYHVASAALLFGLVLMMAVSVWQLRKSSIEITSVFGPDRNENRIPDKFERYLNSLKDPAARKANSYAVINLVELTAPSSMSDGRLRLTVTKYWSALDCLYKLYGDDVVTAEERLLNLVLQSEELRRRYYERVSRAEKEGYLTETLPGLLCPF